MLSDDYFTVPEDGIQGITSVLTVLGGKVVHGDGAFRPLAPELPPAMPDWSPVRQFGGYHRRSDAPGQAKAAMAAACGCAKACGLHGHAHARAWGARPPVSDAAAFWGVFGCSCWAL